MQMSSSSANDPGYFIQSSHTDGKWTANLWTYDANAQPVLVTALPVVNKVTVNLSSGRELIANTAELSTTMRTLIKQYGKTRGLTSTMDGINSRLVDRHPEKGYRKTSRYLRHFAQSIRDKDPHRMCDDLATSLESVARSMDTAR